jgi:hypothetical protein
MRFQHTLVVEKAFQRASLCPNPTICPKVTNFALDSLPLYAYTNALLKNPYRLGLYRSALRGIPEEQRIAQSRPEEQRVILQDAGARRYDARPGLVDRHGPHVAPVDNQRQHVAVLKAQCQGGNGEHAVPMRHGGHVAVLKAKCKWGMVSLLRHCPDRL